MEENPGMTAREATIRSMQELQVALVAIGLVLSASFLPTAFFGGSTGVIYRQFSLTIVSAMVLSVLVALILSPALTATLLKPKRPDGHTVPTLLEQRLPWLARGWEKFHTGFNRLFERATHGYVRQTGRAVEHKWRWLGMFAIVCVATLMLFQRMPTGFLPNEDQGNVMVQWRIDRKSTRLNSRH